MIADRAVRALLDDSRATVGIVADFRTERPGVAEIVAGADEWAAMFALARELRACIVAAGRPFRKDARGFFAIAVQPSVTPIAVAVANLRMAALDSTQTAWLIFADEALQAEIRDVLAQQAATQGRA